MDHPVFEIRAGICATPFGCYWITIIDGRWRGTARITPGFRARIYAKWNEQYRTISNAHKIEILEGGER